jgi:hypothetical protein
MKPNQLTAEKDAIKKAEAEKMAGEENVIEKGDLK